MFVQWHSHVEWLLDRVPVVAVGLGLLGRPAVRISDHQLQVLLTVDLQVWNVEPSKSSVVTKVVIDVSHHV